MSVMIEAIMSHHWNGFSETAVEEITRAATSGSGPAIWLGPRAIRSPMRDFNLHGYAVFQLPGNFSLTYARRSLQLGLAERWGRFLMYKTVRRQFLSSCRRVARMAGATDILVLPEGTILENSVRGGADFREIVRRAVAQLGGLPNLDISRFYAKKEIPITPQDRVHYFLLSMRDLNK